MTNLSTKESEVIDLRRKDFSKKEVEKDLREGKLSQVEIAKRHRISESTVSNIKKEMLE